jgi:2,5-furandicarboxylate decarboxylase 1
LGKDLRTFLAELRAERPGDVLSVAREVDPELELTGVVAKFEERGQYPVLVFRKVKGSDFPVVINVGASNERLALSLGATVHTMVPEFSRRFGAPVPTHLVEGPAPCQDVVLVDDEVDLGRLPLTVHNELDAGRYIGSGVAIVRDPELGLLNAGIYRHQVQGPRQLGFFTNPAFHGDLIRRKYESLGQNMPVAIAIGHHPALLMAAASRPPGVGSELEIAGSLMGESLGMTPGVTVDLPVPALAEVVIEGYVPPHERREEGPFGEWPRYYTGVGEKPFVVVTAITMRRDAIFQDIFAAHPEHNVIGALPRMGSLYGRIKEAVPNLVAVNLPMSGGGVATCYLSIDKQAEGEAKMAAFAAFAVHASIKHVYVVDSDIDVFNEADVLWAMATRFEAHSDLSVVTNALGSWLLPTAYDLEGRRGGIMNTKVIFDATAPAPPADFPPRAVVPAAVLERIDLADGVEPWDGVVDSAGQAVRVS